MSFLPIETPETGRKVKAVIRSEIHGTNSWEAITAFLVAVDESDCNYRFADDNSELSYSSDVVYWEYTGS